MMKTQKITLSIAVMLLAMGFIHSVSYSQYFGRNRVQYDEFDYQVMKTEHFDIYFYPEAKEAVELIAPMAERWYARLSKLFNHELSTRQPLILYASHPHFQQTNVVQGVSEGTGGVTEAFKRRIVMPFAGPLAETDHVLGHELVHAFQYDISGVKQPVVAASGMFRLPLWFIEGMAEYLAVGPYDPHTAMWMREAAQMEEFPTIKKLSSSQYFPYRYGQALWVYLAGIHGDEMIGQVLRAASKSGKAEETLQKYYQADLDSLSNMWKKAIKTFADTVQTVTQPSSEFGKLVLTEKDKKGNLLLAPSISPDGQHIVYITLSDMFSIDFHLADLKTGEIKKKITETAGDPHLQSIQFLYSSGAWDRDGEKFVFAVISNGDPALQIYDVSRDELQQQIDLPSLDEVYNPTWSPDGQRIAFTGLDGGLTDLYVYDIRDESLNRLTRDAFAELQPAWSPDGKTIAFVTDRFSSEVEDYHFGHYELALFDLETNNISALHTFDTAKSINPQWAPDAKHLYFVSDQSGISNLYRVNTMNGAMEKITNLYSGITGITALSPALSVSQGSEHIVFSTYEKTGYQFYKIEPENIKVDSDLNELTAINPGLLPSYEGGQEIMVSSLLEDQTIGLSESSAQNTIEDYKPKLTLDYVAPPSIYGGSSRFGTFVYGGTSALWSDMMGGHNLITGFQFRGGFKTIGLQLGYINRQNRMNWGVIADQTPYLYNFYSTGFGAVDEQPVLIEQEFEQKITSQSLSGVMYYPFSSIQRIEFSAGFNRLSFSQQIKTIATSLTDGTELLDQKDDLPSPDPVNLGQASAAYVYDNSLFGATSPIMGQRYRIEVSPTFGNLQFNTLLMDYRRYIMPVKPFTIAFRGMHYGRYGENAENGYLGPLYLGYQGFVRGYGSGSFDAAEFGPFGTAGVFDFNRLLGSKMLVTNLELRFPLFGLFSDSYYGFLPVEAAAFFDAGVAWDSRNKAAFLGGSREPVKSYGLALRLNVLGFAVVEIDYVKPLDRERKGWIWQFGFTPGF